jgi:DNA-binding GntR family transcriptional regulator
MAALKKTDEGLGAGAKVSLSKAAYGRFIEALHNGCIKLGGNYTQSEICSILEVSVTPLQNALRILENEGFVSIRARSGITVHRPSLNIYRECHQLRQILELAAVPFYVRTVTDEEIQALTDRVVAHRLSTFEGLHEEEIVKEQQAIERKLHHCIIGSMNSDTIKKIYNTNWERTSVFRQWPGRLTAEYVRQTADEHLVLLRAVEARDTEGAVSALRQHMLLSLDRGIMTNLYFDLQ